MNGKAVKPETTVTLEALRKRHTTLNEERIRAQKELEIASQDLEKLKKEAMEQFGTDDIQQLAEKLAQIKAENARKLEEYQQHLLQLEKGLAEVDSQFSQG